MKPASVISDVRVKYHSLTSSERQVVINRIRELGSYRFATWEDYMDAMIDCGFYDESPNPVDEIPTLTWDDLTREQHTAVHKYVDDNKIVPPALEDTVGLTFKAIGIKIKDDDILNPPTKSKYQLEEAANELNAARERISFLRERQSATDKTMRTMTENHSNEETRLKQIIEAQAQCILRLRAESDLNKPVQVQPVLKGEEIAW